MTQALDISLSDMPEAGEALHQNETVAPREPACARKRPISRPCRMLLADRIDRQFPLIRPS